ncbi:MAG: ketoacyl-ACP synthase III [Planctomycetota bacterium]|nr:ketoacyl-ACP synthase III [Planctomycetota bacterium]
MNYASLGPVAVYLPERVEDNAWLKSEFPDWPMDVIYEKIGIEARHVARADECASDLAVKAAERLFDDHDIERDSIDFLLFCTQTPDYPLPTTACLLQDRLGLPTSIGALDYNLGCSGYVYGLSLADGLIRGGMANRVLLITAETYSKYIHPEDRSLRTVFGDGAAATLIEAAPEQSIGPFVFGTDGRGANHLMVTEGGARPQDKAHKPSKRKRWDSSLFMNGPELVKFALDVVPDMVENLLAEQQIEQADIDMFLMHQATMHMLDHLRKRLEIEENCMPVNLHAQGNTVSSTLPILASDLRDSGRLRPGKQTMMISFGVGLSWAGCLWRETWEAKQAGGGDQPLLLEQARLPRAA